MGTPPVTPISAVALERRIDLRQAVARLRWPELRRYSYGSVFSVDGGGRLYLFSFGAVVLDNAEVVAESVLRVIQDATDSAALYATAETYYVAVDRERAAGAPRVGWDRVVIPERSTELVGAVALLLGQSTALERYEHAAEGLIDEALVLARRIAQKGEYSHASRAQLQQIGRITNYRLELARLFYLLDRPEETWEDPGVAALYDALFQNLELRERHQAVLQKLEAVEHVTDVVINLWQARVSNRLEWTIVLLIVIEIVLALFKIV